jgi:hypothetical protein
MDRPGPREEPFEVVYYGPAGAAEYCSHRGVSKAGGTSLPLISEVPNDHMDLTADARLAAFVRMGEQGTTLAVVESPGSGPPAIRQGPTLPMRRGFKPRVALSDDGSRIAMSLGDRIEVFAYPGFTPVDRFSAENVEHMRFRPLTH